MSAACTPARVSVTCWKPSTSFTGEAPGARLYIVGEGPSEAEYRAKAARSASRDAIRFCGARTDPRSYLLAADIFALPSHADPAPLVLSEAREAGCAIVATEVDGIPELLEHGRAGILVPAASPARLAEALSQLLLNPEALASWRSRSQINIENMSIARVAHSTLSVYAECFPSAYRSQPEELLL